jgi:hypothetical protein
MEQREHLQMVHGSIHVKQRACGFWNVSGDVGQSRSFRIRAHAVAFARALAFTTKSTLFFHDADGSSVRQTRASMTYPLVLA